MYKDSITSDKKQEGISPALPGEVGLDYQPFDFRKKRWRSAAMAKVAETAGFEQRAEKYAACGVQLGFGLNETGRHLSAANFCRQRFCPICTARLAKKNAQQLAKVLTEAQRRNPGTRYLFLTLAPRSVMGEMLPTAITDMLSGWRRLLKKVPMQRAVLGSFRAIEITRNAETGAYHPHIHAIVAVPAEYFEKSAGLYIAQADLVRMWQHSLRVGYAPTAHISALYAKGSDGDRDRRPGESDPKDAVREAAKYSVKDADILDRRMPVEEQAKVWHTLLDALHHRRLAAFGGLLREVARALGAEELEKADIIGADESEENAHIAYEFFEGWGWSQLISEYVCTDSYHVDPVTLEVSGCSR